MSRCEGCGEKACDGDCLGMANVREIAARDDTIASLTRERDLLRQQYADADRDLKAEIARRAECEREIGALNDALGVLDSCQIKPLVDSLGDRAAQAEADRDRLVKERDEARASARDADAYRMQTAARATQAEAARDRLAAEVAEQERETAELHELIAEAAGDPYEATSDDAEDGGERASPEQCVRLLADAVKDRDRLAAELAEADALLSSVGAITCGNGQQHDRLRGCLYCARDREQARAEAAEAEVARLRSDLRHEEQLHAERRALVERLRGLLGEARTCASAHERLPDIVPSAMPGDLRDRIDAAIRGTEGA